MALRWTATSSNVERLKPLLRLLTILLIALLGQAADWRQLKPEGYISDFAGVMDAGAKASINAYLAAVERATGAQVAIVTINSLEADPIEDVAHTLYESFGVGRSESNEGALFLIAIQDRRTRLEVGYGLEPYVPDGAAGEILRAMRPALRQGAYGAALTEASRVLGERIAAGKGVAIDQRLPARPVRRQREPDWSDNTWVRLLVFLLFLYLMSKFGGGRPRGYYYGGGYRGGWGGATGGRASWGGFGGGRSGGGGASSSW